MSTFLTSRFRAARRRLPLGAGLALGGLCASAALAYEQSAAHPAHQWFTNQAQLYFSHQFGASQLDGFVARIVQGVVNEDVMGAFAGTFAGPNPWGEGLPFNRHFWAHTGAGFDRTFNDGILAFDSAPNRAYQLFSGGVQLNGAANTSWGGAQGAVAGRGIVWNWQNNNRNRAYEWLGHAIHLMQDATLPCHSHADDHIVGQDNDPLHDWVDGLAFSTTDPAPRTAGFNDPAADRFQLWRFHAGQGKIGRDGGTQPLEFTRLRNEATLRALVVHATAAPTEQADGRALYRLFAETAELADDFDSKDAPGQVNPGMWRTGGGGPGSYDAWTMDELNTISDRLATRSIRASAELFRYFYSLIDPTAPFLGFNLLSANEAVPLGIILDPMATILADSMTAADDISGVEQQGFSYVLQKKVGDAWQDIEMRGPQSRFFSFQLTMEGLYRVCSMVENGAGLSTQSYGYLQVVPGPGAAVLLAGAAGFAGLRRRRRAWVA